MSSKNKQIYIEYCEKNDVIIFNEPWWLDAVTKKVWDVAVVEKNNQLIAALPYHAKRKGIFNVMLSPILTPFVEIILNTPPDLKKNKHLAFEKEHISALIKQFPSLDYSQFKLHYNQTNWLPFHWAKYKEATRYSYIIEPINNLDDVKSNFRENVRREIKKAEKTLEIKEIADLEDIADLLLQNSNVSLATFKNIDAACNRTDARKILAAYDKDGNIHGCIYLVFDHTSAYYLTGGANDQFKTSGAMSLLLWEAIKISSSSVDKFDFEGSMIESVERFFRGFGGTQVSYFELFKSKNIVLETAIKLFKR